MCEKKQLKPVREKIGLKQGKQIAHMPHRDRLCFLAEGLPLIARSAIDYWSVASSVKDHPREAEVLARNAEEEAVKALILMDIVRCPPKRAAAHAGKLMSYFYNHLARMIWADMCGAFVDTPAEIQHYVDMDRTSHHLDGPNDVDWIYTNTKLHRREAQLYVDIESDDSGRLHWSTPDPGFTSFIFEPSAVQAVAALLELGAFSIEGLKIVSEIWAQEYFEPDSTIATAKRLTEQTIAALIEAKLHVETATNDHVQALYRSWPMPMYNVDFTLIEVDVADLRAEQAAWMPPDAF